LNTLAEELRDTLGTALPQLHKNIKKSLTTGPDLKPLLALIDWSDFLATARKGVANNEGFLTRDLTPQQEMVARTYIKDTSTQNFRKLDAIFNTSEVSKEIRTKFKQTELPVTVTPQLLKILDDASKHQEVWSEVTNKDPVYNDMHHQVREMLISGSESFRDKEAMLLALQKSFFLDERDWAQWESLPIEDIAKELRDTLGIAMPKLREDIKRDLTTRPDLKPLLQLIDWNNLLGTAKDNASQSYSLSENPGTLRHVYSGDTVDLAARLIGGAVAAFIEYQPTVGNETSLLQSGAQPGFTGALHAAIHPSYSTPR
jgi:hypothetical protein